jgi:hypothetical protein
MAAPGGGIDASVSLLSTTGMGRNGEVAAGWAILTARQANVNIKKHKILMLM